MYVAQPGIASGRLHSAVILIITVVSHILFAVFYSQMANNANKTICVLVKHKNRQAFSLMRWRCTQQRIVRRRGV
jgi:preprotein translocase subunit SecY